MVQSSDVVEEALAHALKRAAEAGEWAAVAQLSKELEARRLARAGVPVLGDVRRAKGGM